MNLNLYSLFYFYLFIINCKVNQLFLSVNYQKGSARIYLKKKNK